jgi:hypothetical protein
MSIISGLGSMKGKIAGGALSVGFGLYDYNSRLKEGQSPGRAFGGAVAETLLWELPITRPFMMAGMVGELAEAGGKFAVEKYYDGLSNRRGRYMGNFGGRYDDNEIRGTMRQRGMAAIQESRLNARTILGSEARSLHRRQSSG